MIHKIEGNILESNAEALVNTVNTVGVMGKGIALQFKKAFPHNYKVYKTACEDKKLNIGELLVVEEESLIGGKKLIINFPTKKHWRSPSEYEYIEKGLQQLVKIITERNIKSIAVPPLGAGNGGLVWAKVSAIIERHLSGLDVEVQLYQPSSQIKEVLHKERVKLTPARAMLLAVLYDLVRQGEMVSEFAAEKVCYFLQRFGAENDFNLKFEPNYYGPYSGKVRHVLYQLNGSYVMGYSAKDKKPFEELSLVMETETDVLAYLEAQNEPRYLQAVEQAKTCLDRFYSSFSLELLSTVDFIQSTTDKRSIEDIRTVIHSWSHRKSKLFSNDRYLQLALDRLSEVGLMQ